MIQDDDNTTTGVKPTAQIVPGWWKKYTVWLAVIAAAAPDLLQWALLNIEFLGLIGSYDDVTKEKVRIILVALIPIAAMIKQQRIPKEPHHEAR